MECSGQESGLLQVVRVLLERLGEELWWLETLERRGWMMDQRQALVRRQPRHVQSVIRSAEDWSLVDVLQLTAVRYSPIGLCVLAVLEESSVFTYTYSASKHEASLGPPANPARQASSTELAPLLRSH